MRRRRVDAPPGANGLALETRGTTVASISPGPARPGSARPGQAAIATDAKD